MSTVESISETVSKKRGRPQIHNPDYVREIACIVAPEVTSNRQKQARALAQVAVRCILKDHVILPGVENIFSNTTNTMLVSVLEHLGRLQIETSIDDADILAAARWLSSRFASDRTFTVRRAVALLRLLREEVLGRLYMGIDHHPMDKLLPLMEVEL